jgi:RNA recognition motif-containing protein
MASPLVEEEANGYENSGPAMTLCEEAELAASDATVEAQIQNAFDPVLHGAPRHPKNWAIPYFSPKSGLYFPANSLHPDQRASQPQQDSAFQKPATQRSAAKKSGVRKRAIVSVDKGPFLFGQFQSGVDGKQNLRHDYPVLSHQAYFGIIKRKELPKHISDTPFHEEYNAYVLFNRILADVKPHSEDRGPEYSIFVGDLGPEVNEYVLVSLFQARFPSCKSAKIMTDAMSGQSRGYGFVRFSDETDQQRALMEMQGVYCGNRPMRVSTATPKNRNNNHGYGGPGNHQGNPMMGGNMPQQQQQQMWGAQQQGGMQGGYGYGGGAGGFNPATQMNQFTDPNNTTVFVGGLSGYVTEDELRSFFQGFGEITYVKIPPGKGCGFVQFVHRHAAEMAINQMQGYPIGNSRVRLSWGRSQNNSGVGTPYRPAPPPPHYLGMPAPGPGPYGGPHFPGPQGPPGAPQ